MKFIAARLGGGRRMGVSEFNVAIRTILKDGQRLRFNVGGGVVYDSTAEAEYEEALWKARYATKLQKT